MQTTPRPSQFLLFQGRCGVPGRLRYTPVQNERRNYKRSNSRRGAKPIQRASSREDRVAAALKTRVAFISAVLCGSASAPPDIPLLCTRPQPPLLVICVHRFSNECCSKPVFRASAVLVSQVVGGMVLARELASSTQQPFRPTLPQSPLRSKSGQ